MGYEDLESWCLDCMKKHYPEQWEKNKDLYREWFELYVNKADEEILICDKCGATIKGEGS